MTPCDPYGARQRPSAHLRVPAGHAHHHVDDSGRTRSASTARVAIHHPMPRLSSSTAAPFHQSNFVALRPRSRSLPPANVGRRPIALAALSPLSRAQFDWAPTRSTRLCACEVFSSGPVRPAASSAPCRRWCAAAAPAGRQSERGPASRRRTRTPRPRP